MEGFQSMFGTNDVLSGQSEQTVDEFFECIDSLSKNPELTNLILIKITSAITFSLIQPHLAADPNLNQEQINRKFEEFLVTLDENNYQVKSKEMYTFLEQILAKCEQSGQKVPRKRKREFDSDFNPQSQRMRTE